MKSIFRFTGAVSAIVVMAAVAGCSTGQAGPSADKMEMMDMKTMCDMHEKMKTKTPEEQKAMMDEHMKTMSPEKKQEHMTMMQEKCKA